MRNSTNIWSQSDKKNKAVILIVTIVNILVGVLFTVLCLFGAIKIFDIKVSVLNISDLISNASFLFEKGFFGVFFYNVIGLVILIIITVKNLKQTIGLFKKFLEILGYSEKLYTKRDFRLLLDRIPLTIPLVIVISSFFGTSTMSSLGKIVGIIGFTLYLANNVAFLAVSDFDWERLMKKADIKSRISTIIVFLIKNAITVILFLISYRSGLFDITFILQNLASIKLIYILSLLIAVGRFTIVIAVYRGLTSGGSENGIEASGFIDIFLCEIIISAIAGSITFLIPFLAFLLPFLLMLGQGILSAIFPDESKLLNRKAVA